MTGVRPSLEATYTHESAPFALDSGRSLERAAIRYAVYGEPSRDNVVLVCHALSGSAAAVEWWPDMFGRGRPFDLDHVAVVCANVLGSCYGSTGPTSIDPATGEPYGATFPVLTMRDLARAHALLLDHLGVERIRLAIGGSIGGMQALQLAIDAPGRVARCIAIGAAPLGAMGLALNHLQRAAIGLDPARGLALARQIAMCSYKSAELFDDRHGRRTDRAGGDPYRSLDDRFDVAGYLDRQGELFVDRFDAASYVALSRAMDTFEPGRGYANEHEALARVTAKTLLVGISSDWLFPAAAVRELAGRLRDAGADASYAELVTSHGHDGFLADGECVAALCRAFLQEEADAAACAQVRR
jgi:homoserine O-acetyltransferase